MQTGSLSYKIYWLREEYKGKLIKRISRPGRSGAAYQGKGVVIAAYFRCSYGLVPAIAIPADH